MPFQYHVALSFADEDRNVVAPIAEVLTREGLRVFYDKYEEVTLWGKDLYQHLHDVYRNKAEYCVIFSSASYAAKTWTKHELKSAQERALSENEEYILLARLDETEIPGIRQTTAYLNIWSRPGDEVARLIIEKVKGSRRSSVTSEPEVMPQLVTSNDRPDRGSREDLIQLRREIEDLRRASAPRLLSGDSEKVLAANLQGIQPSSIGVLAPETDEEAQDYAEAIAAVFRQVGWAVESYTAIYASSVIGVKVVAYTGVGWPIPPIPNVANRIAAAFQEAGVAATVDELREMPNRFKIFIAVGKKPRRVHA